MKNQNAKSVDSKTKSNSESKVTTKPTNKKRKTNKKDVTQDPKQMVFMGMDEIKSRIESLQSAYINAISGEIKFGDVKTLFKKLHKEIKYQVKIHTSPSSVEKKRK